MAFVARGLISGTLRDANRHVRQRVLTCVDTTRGQAFGIYSVDCNARASCCVDYPIKALDTLCMPGVEEKAV